MKLDYLNTHFINNTYRLVVAAASTISYRLDFSCENCLPFFGIFGCTGTWWKYMILAKSVITRIWAPDRALDGRWNVKKRGPKYILLSTDFSDDVWHQNGAVRAPSERRNTPPWVARSAVGPRHRLGTLRRDVEKRLKTPWVWGIRKNFKNNVFLRIPSLTPPSWWC